jgi:hypothetical protein
MTTDTPAMDPGSLPSGTVTFLFTDIVTSKAYRSVATEPARTAEVA